MEHKVRLWLINTAAVREEQVQALLPLLSESEAARYRRFVRPQRQRQFLVGRLLLRRALCAVLGLPADALAVEEHVGHAPRVLLPAGVAPPGFSISHSGDWVACAVSASTALGTEPESRRMNAFYRMWSSKEARFKLGTGSDAAASCVALAHPELSIVVCSAQPLAAAPLIEAFSID